MTVFDCLYNPYPTRRVTSVAQQGMVATSQPLAAQAGLDILKKSGNAVDAAIATAAALTVLEPTANGIGGDAFAIVWMKDNIYGINGSGPAPKNISIEALKSLGHKEIPRHGFVPVTVPGAPSTWAKLSERFGKLPLSEVLKPAIRYAEKGYPLSPVLAKYWNIAYDRYKALLKGPEFEHWFKTFASKGKPPKVGEVWRSQAHADTLRSIGETKAKSFYEGDIADKIVAFSEKHGGFFTKEDLANFEAEWVNPISVNYRGYDIWEIPPNGQGIVALMALNILKEFKFSSKESIDTYHKQIEAMKLAFTDGKAFIADQSTMSYKVKDLLSDEYARLRRSLITDKALEPKPGTPPSSGTVYLATADSEGNMVSLIQSNYMGFGSGLVVPNTGIALQNRGHSFSFDEESDNALKGGKRSYHTIIPGFISQNNQPIGPFGIVGGFMQPQAHVQVAMNLIDFGLNPQAALDAPRWQWMEGKQVLVEADFCSNMAEALFRRGHEVSGALEHGGFGRGQVIWRDPTTGTLFGGTESRMEGTIASF